MLKHFQKLQIDQHSPTHSMKLELPYFKSQLKTLQEKKIQSNICNEYGSRDASLIPGSGKSAGVRNGTPL